MKSPDRMKESPVSQIRSKLDIRSFSVEAADPVLCAIDGGCCVQPTSDAAPSELRNVRRVTGILYCITPTITEIGGLGFHA